MPRRTLHVLLPLRGAIIRIRNLWLRIAIGAEVDDTVQLSLSSRLLPGRRGSIVVGSDTLIAFKTLIYTRDPITGADRPVRIGSRCFIGGGSMILPGVTIGDGSIVGGGAVVVDDVPARSIVGGLNARLPTSARALRTAHPELELVRQPDRPGR
jgi:acetyltransferase-like isoleucine patch superfamily enzyme